MQEATYYGQEVDTNRAMPLKERLRGLYEPEDFVTVQNIDTKPIKYQFTSPNDRETWSDYPGHKNTIMKKPPTVVTVQPGDTKLCPAYEADRFLETLVKQIAMTGINQKVESGEISDQRATADWTDPTFQTTVLSKAFIGKKDVLGIYNTQTEPANDVEKDLQLDEPTVASKSRKATA